MTDEGAIRPASPSFGWGPVFCCHGIQAMFSRLKFRQADFSHKVQGSYFISTLHIFFTYFCFKTHFLTDPIRSNFELAPEAEMSLNGGVGFEWEGKAEGVTLSQCVTPQPQFPPRIFDKVHTHRQTQTRRGAAH